MGYTRFRKVISMHREVLLVNRRAVERRKEAASSGTARVANVRASAQPLRVRPYLGDHSLLVKQSPPRGPAAEAQLDGRRHPFDLGLEHDEHNAHRCGFVVDEQATSPRVRAMRWQQRRDDRPPIAAEQLTCLCPVRRKVLVRIKTPTLGESQTRGSHTEPPVARLL
jgi:hypothetical protein